MTLTIGDNVIRLADKCEKHHRCLEGNKESICPVRAYDRHKTLFVECKSSEKCVYQKSFGEIHSCTCPMRIEIFRLYGI